MSRKEILLRVANFEDSGLIIGYGFKLFLPGIHGGKWYWACIAGDATSRQIKHKSIPFLEEVVENLTFPSGVCPNISMLFYTKNLREIKPVPNKMPGMKYAEVYKIGEYSVAIPRILLKEDWQILSELYSTKHLDYARINALTNSPKSDTEVRLSRLVWTRKNRQGIMAIAPNFNWSVIKNYMHIHLAVVTKMRTKDLRRLLRDIGFVGNIASRFKKRYLQIEFDMWGFSDLRVIVDRLSGIDRLSIEGCSFAFKNTVYDEWVNEFIQDQI